jgi:hypothetical protein
MTERKRELAGQSNKLLDALRHLKAVEKRKRDVPISTPTFHELANDVNATSREIFRIARNQDRIGDELPTGSESIEDVNHPERADDEKTPRGAGGTGTSS